MNDHVPFETLDETQSPNAVPGLVFVCDHASNMVPPGITPLGLPAEDMQRHIAYDVGARSVTLPSPSPCASCTWYDMIVKHVVLPVVRVGGA